MSEETQSDKIARLWLEKTHLKKLLIQSRDLIWILGRDIKSVTLPNNKKVELSDFFEKLERAISKGKEQ